MALIRLFGGVFLTAVSCHASALQKRVVATSFNVTDFTASCQPHGSGCSFNFKAATNLQLFPTVCSDSFSTAAYSLPDVPFVACQGAYVIWSFRAVGLANHEVYNYTLTLADVTQGIAAVKVWPASDFPSVDFGSTVAQSYVGEENFIVEG